MCLDISEGVLESRRYELVEVWFHWGNEDSRGSEHTVNYKAYPMEVLYNFTIVILYQSMPDFKSLVFFATSKLKL